MKDQYVGDINDYAKYAVLRALAEGHGGRIVVCWMLTPPDERSDGRHTGYLEQPERYRALEPALFDALRMFLDDRVRSVESIEQAGLLTNAIYDSSMLPDGLEGRRRYFQALWGRMLEGDFVFFDPDNGLEVSSVAKGRLRSSKYLFWDEWRLAASSDRSICVYQHFPRVPRDRFVRRLLAQMQGFAPRHTVFSLHSTRVAFLVAAAPGQSRRMLAAARGIATDWAGALTLIVPEKRSLMGAPPSSAF